MVSTSSPNIAIIGAGRLGTALGRLLRENGAPLAAIASRSPDNARCAAEFVGQVQAISIDQVPHYATHLLIAVSDGAIATVAAQLHRAGFQDGIALHTSGSRGPSELDALRTAGVATGAIHPLQTVPSAQQGMTALPGSYFATCGEERAVAWAHEIITVLHGHPLRIPAERWGLYHSAAVFASNYLISSIDAALEAMEAAGVTRSDALAALSPLCQAAVANTLTLGPDAALTGPISRGDAQTVRRNREGLRAISKESQDAYCAAGLRTLPIARRRGLPEPLLAELELALTET